MRSMTQSSAGDTTTGPPLLPNISSTWPNPTPQTNSATRRPPSAISQSPPSLQHHFFDVHNDSHWLSQQSRQHVTRAIQNGWAESTVQCYSGAIKQFIRFCDAEGVPGHLRFPADEFVLCAFAASNAGLHSRTTPHNRLSALKTWHTAHNMEWKGSTCLRYVLNGVHNLAPNGSKN
jgi:hypothetical protein